jgi:hypothetical protein
MNADLDMDELKKQFERTKNPVFVWYAIMDQSWCDAPLPEWIDTYLQSVAKNMVSLYYTERLEREAELVGKALGFGGEKKGDNGKFSEAQKFDRDLMLYNQVVWAMTETPGKKRLNLSGAFDLVAEIFPDVKAATVRRAYLDFHSLKGNKSSDE